MACRATEVFLEGGRRRGARRAGGGRPRAAAGGGRAARYADAGGAARTRHVRFEVVAEVQALGRWRLARGAGGQRAPARDAAERLDLPLLLRVDEGELFQQYVRAQRQRVQSWVSRDGAWVEFVNCGTEEHPISCFYRDEDGPICLHRAWVQGDARILHWDDAFLGSAA